MSSYGILKLTAERYLGMYARNFGLAVRVLRIANVHGPGQPATRGQGVVSHLFRCAITGCPLPLFGSPASVRDYQYVDDVARVVADLLRARRRAVAAECRHRSDPNPWLVGEWSRFLGFASSLGADSGVRV